MVDYGPGDEIVYIGKTDERVHAPNTIYVCEDLRPSLHIEGISEHQLNKYCGGCKSSARDIIGVLTNAGSKTSTWACSCSFRKKLDFKKLCNVDETIKIKEDA